MRTPLLITTAFAAVLALAACGGNTGTGGSTSAGQAGGDFKPLSRIEIIAPAAPGSGWDQTARAVQEAMKTDGLARSVEVKNVPGASGTVALAQVAPQKGKSDLLIASGLAMMSGIITNGTDVTLDDLTPVARIVGEYEVIVVPKSVPFNNADELFAAIKADPKSVAIAGGSAGSADQIFIGLLAQHYGVKPSDVNYVPYSGGGEATTALLGGHVQAGVAGLNEFSEQIKNGNLKGLLISSTDQVEGVTFAQTTTQIDPKLEFQNWRSIMAPGGIDDALKNQYVEALTRMHESSGWSAAVKKNGWNDNFLVVTSSPPGSRKRTRACRRCSPTSVWPSRRVSDRRIRACRGSTAQVDPVGRLGHRRGDPRYRCRRPAGWCSSGGVDVRVGRRCRIRAEGRRGAAHRAGAGSDGAGGAGQPG